MAGINEHYEVNVIIHSPLVIEVNTVYNNHFIRRVYLGTTYSKAMKQFDEDIKKGKY